MLIQRCVPRGDVYLYEECASRLNESFQTLLFVSMKIKSREIFILSIFFSFSSFSLWGGRAMVFGKLPVLGRSTNLVNSRARACSRCGWGLIGLCLRSLSLSLGNEI